MALSDSPVAYHGVEPGQAPPCSPGRLRLSKASRATWNLGVKAVAQLNGMVGRAQIRRWCPRRGDLDHPSVGPVSDDRLAAFTKQPAPANA